MIVISDTDRGGDRYSQSHKNTVYAKCYWDKIEAIPFKLCGMSLQEILPTINQLSHQDKLRLIHFLLLELAREDGCTLELNNDDEATKQDLLKQLASTQAVVWSPQADSTSVQALSDLLAKSQSIANA